MAQTKITSNVLALSAAQNNLNANSVIFLTPPVVASTDFTWGKVSTVGTYGMACAQSDGTIRFYRSSDGLNPIEINIPSNYIGVGTIQTNTIRNSSGTVSFQLATNNIVEQRNGLNPQEFRIYNTYTSATSAERTAFKYINNDFVISTESLPLSAPQRSMLFQTASATRMTILSSGEVGVGQAPAAGISFIAAGTIQTSNGNIVGATVGAIGFAGRSRIYSPADGTLQFRNNANTSDASITVNNITGSGVISVSAGTVAVPSINFGDPSTGIYRAAADRIGFTVANSLKMVVYANGTYMNTGAAFGINTANWFRIGAGGVELTTTTGGGTYAPLYLSSLFASGSATIGNDIEVTDFTKGVILRSPDNSRWRITATNTGALSTTKL